MERPRFLKKGSIGAVTAFGVITLETILGNVAHQADLAIGDYLLPAAHAAPVASPTPGSQTDAFEKLTEEYMRLLSAPGSEVDNATLKAFVDERAQQFGAVKDIFSYNFDNDGNLVFNQRQGTVSGSERRRFTTYAAVADLLTLIDPHVRDMMELSIDRNFPGFREFYKSRTGNELDGDDFNIVRSPTGAINCIPLNQSLVDTVNAAYLSFDVKTKQKLHGAFAAHSPRPEKDVHPQKGHVYLHVAGNDRVTVSRDAIRLAYLLDKSGRKQREEVEAALRGENKPAPVPALTVDVNGVPVKYKTDGDHTDVTVSYEGNQGKLNPEWDDTCESKIRVRSHKGNDWSKPTHSNIYRLQADSVVPEDCVVELTLKNEKGQHSTVYLPVHVGKPTPAAPATSVAPKPQPIPVQPIPPAPAQPVVPPQQSATTAPATNDEKNWSLYTGPTIFAKMSESDEFGVMMARTGVGWELPLHYQQKDLLGAGSIVGAKLHIRAYNEDVHVIAEGVDEMNKMQHFTYDLMGDLEYNLIDSEDFALWLTAVAGVEYQVRFDTEFGEGVETRYNNLLGKLGIGMYAFDRVGLEANVGGTRALHTGVVNNTADRSTAINTSIDTRLGVKIAPWLWASGTYAQQGFDEEQESQQTGEERTTMGAHIDTKSPFDFHYKKNGFGFGLGYEHAEVKTPIDGTAHDEDHFEFKITYTFGGDDE